MKRLLGIFILIFTISFAFAQPLNVITPTDGETWWGYANISGTGSYRTVGTNVAETSDVAIYIPGTNAAVVGNSIKAIRLFFDKIDGIKDVKVWLSTTLPSNASKANIITQTVSDRELNAYKTSQQSIDVLLNSPYTVTNSGVYVGYSFTASDNSNLMPVVVSLDKDLNNSFFLHSSKSFTSWDDMSSMGASAIQVLISGSIKQDAVNIAPIGDIYVEANKSASMRVRLKNEGTNQVSNIGYKVSFDGMPSPDSEETIDIDMRASDEERTLTIPLYSFPDVGNYDFSVEICSVNGNTNSVTAVSTGVLHVVDRLEQWQRKVLIEEFTTEPCPNCPMAASRLHQAYTDYPELNEQSMVVCHHTAYGTDWLTVGESNSYQWFFGGTGVSYAPAFMYDRYHFADNDDPQYGGGPAERQKPAEGIKQRIDERLAVPSNVGIELMAYVNDDKSAVNVIANCQRGMPFGDKSERITLFLTEDNIPARNQKGTTEEFIHQHVLRAVNHTWGAPLNWNDNRATYTYSFPINADWELDQLKVVAAVSNYDSSNCDNCVVEQSEWVKVAADNSSISTLNEDEAPSVVARYGINGQRVNTSQCGIVIEKLSNGSWRKIMVR